MVTTSVAGPPRPAPVRCGHDRTVLADVVSHLCCPVCRGSLALDAGALGCGQGHRFDVARQGYASLLHGDARTGTADTAAMVAAREEFLASGEYEPLTNAVTAAVTAHLTDPRPGSCLVDAGGGTGRHLAALLGHLPEHVGVACDLSRYAARRAARAHPRIGAVVADVWRGLPVRDGTADVVLNMFAPRNAPEFRRTLRPGGLLVVVTPAPDHLGEVVERLGLLRVDADKPRRLHDALHRDFEVGDEQHVRWSMRLTHRGVYALVAMGPSAWHTDDVGQTVAQLPEPVSVTGAVTVSTYRPLAR